MLDWLGPDYITRDELSQRGTMYLGFPLFSENRASRIGVSVGDFNDSRIGNLSYIKYRFYTDLQKYRLGYYKAVVFMAFRRKFFVE